MMNLEDIECIRKVRSGDIGAFAVIVDRYKAIVFNIVCKIINDRQHAEDITQDVFIKVFRSLGKFKEKSKFSTWLYSITYNTTISAIRKIKSRCIIFNDSLQDAENSELLDELDAVSKEEKLKCLEQVLKQMPVEDSLLITLHYIEEQPVASVAEITGLSQSNVKIRLYRIRKYMNFEINKLLKKDE
ncbi:MAG: RNA polymerase sigma factor [Prevotellaceae bacterium]|jgi:RNA polymerase sigma-70 factor (ECF subfamily)|nr:RNA polymerase sigma factor [Prevotellaceae bacterium]